jgi:hypothetical protein
MCIGPVTLEDIPDAALWISNAINIIEIDAHKAWKAKNDVFLFKFQVSKSFTRSDARRGVVI